ncbi:putative invertase inhibitor [Chenopodium quinoa]|uniref:putative invertase inhibitor n=1 Tax=Chenopodium quinoa TaxID=63459 RepID=UPI000B789312|nr:putative invertase inhibitor [Chenopodium quinoa]
MECYVMSLVVFIGCLTFSQAKATNLNLIPDTCMKISKSDPKNINYDFCVKALTSYRRSTNPTIDELVEISFKLSSSKAQSIITTIAKLRKDPKLSPFAKSALGTCSDLYSDAQSDLQEGLDALKGKDLSTANVRISAAMDSGPDCEDTFKEKEGEASPLTKENSEYFKLADIFLAFTVILKK